MQEDRRKKYGKVNEPIDRGRWFHRFPKSALWSVALLSILVTCVVAELAARVFFPGWAPSREERVKFWTYDSLLGWKHIPG